MASQQQQQQQHLQSSGRGGAGNILHSTQSPALQPGDLETPTLKTAVVTTGRGGSGNMAENSDPAGTRKRQDVEPVVRHESDRPTPTGRGGMGNFFDKEKSPEPAAEAAAAAPRARAQEAGQAATKPAPEAAAGWADKGKNLLFGNSAAGEKK